MRIGRLLVVTVLFLTACVSPVEHPASAKRAAVDQELDRLAGTWVLVGGYLDGKPVADDQVKRSRITWNGNKISTQSPHIQGEVIVATSAVDPTTDPRRMDIVYEGGRPTQGALAIYEWLGPDRYRIAIDRRGGTRPAEFVSEPGTGQTLHVWQREK
jgi:uncharacterized protein (TIGR03067 family)